MNIILIGFKSSGKTTNGKILAEQLNRAFVDTDHLIEQRHTMLTQEVLPFREIFRHYGQDYFLELEAHVLTDLPHLENHIIAVGGGTFINHAVSEAVRETAHLVYLYVKPQILWKRIEAGGIPAFFKTDKPQSEFYDLFEKRSPIYRQVADYTVEVNHASSAVAANKILQTLNWSK